MMNAARCSRALGAPSRRFYGVWLSQPGGAYPPLPRCGRPSRKLHTTLAISQQQPQQQQQVVLDKQQLGWQDLHRAAQIAAWSGLCYLMPDELRSTIQQKHQGLTLVAAGRNGYTAWFVADGVVPAAQFCTTISSRSSSAAAHGGAAAAGQHSANHGSSNGDNNNNTQSHAGRGGVGGVCTRVPQGTRERFVFFRGVQWAAPDINSTQLSQALMSLWPTQFPAAASGPSNGQQGGASGGLANSPLVAHAGVAGIAQGLFSQLRPYMQQADDVGMPLCFAGHSLGGSLAMLMLVLHQMHRKDRQQRPWPSCYTFGSPPVLAHERGGGGGPVLQALGLPPDAINSFVLEMDPVPRALLSVDPTFQALSGWSAVKGLLQLRELFVGSGSPLSPGRFLFEAVGQVHLIKWTPEGGSCVVPLDATEIEQELSLLSPRPPGSTSKNGNGQQPAAAAAEAAGGVGGASAGAPTPGVALEQQVQEASGVAAAPGAAAGGAAAALMNSLRAWLDHHHRSYAQELEAAALRAVRQQLAAEQRPQATQQSTEQGRAHHQQQQQRLAQRDLQQQQQREQEGAMQEAHSRSL